MLLLTGSLLSSLAVTLAVSDVSEEFTGVLTSVYFTRRRFVHKYNNMTFSSEGFELPLFFFVVADLLVISLVVAISFEGEKNISELNIKHPEK